MVSPFHFHGYHVKIIDVKIHQTMLGWEKDTFPVFPGEAMTLLLVPDQPGMFPVHNHNLVTVDHRWLSWRYDNTSKYYAMKQLILALLYVAPLLGLFSNQTYQVNFQNGWHISE